MQRLRKIYPLMPFVAGLTPFLVSAQGTIGGILTTIHGVVNIFIPLLMTIAIAVFLYGIVLYISSGGDAEKEKTARGYIIYGIIGLFILVAFWGLVTVLANTFGISSGTTPITPQTSF